MDWKIVLSAFSALFLAELGDKTQLAVLTLAATSGRPTSVFVGASVALVVVTAIGVGVGGALGSVLPLQMIRRIGALAFIVIGVAMLLDWI